MINKYKKKPVEVDAVQYTGNNGSEIRNFVGELLTESKPPASMELDKDIPNEAYQILIPTLEGTMICNRLDYVIKGVKGEFYPCKPDIFNITYDKVNE